MFGAAHPQREVEDARAELVLLATNHFPELPRLHPDIFEVVSELKVHLSCRPNLVWNNGCTRDSLTPFSLKDA